MDKNRIMPCLRGRSPAFAFSAASAPCCLFFIFCLIFLPSCSSTDIKREVRVPQETREIKSEMPMSSRPKTPDFVPVAEDISPLKSKIVDIVARNTALRDALHVIADATGMNLVMQKGVNPETLVTLTLRNVTAEDALNTIFTSVDYFYSVKDNMLIVKAVDTRIFELGHPSMIQSFSVDVGGDILGTAPVSGGAAPTTTSGLKGGVTQSTKGDATAFGFWDAIEKSITTILAASSSQPAAAGQAPNAASPSPLQPSFTINRLTGTIMVTAAKNDIARVEQYINTIKKVINRQVLVEAKIIDVQLSDTMQYGIDWSVLDMNNLGKVTIGTSKYADTIGTTTPSFQIGVSKWNFTGLLKAMQDQGEVRILSNPRVNIMNGQTALLSVGRNSTFISQVTSTTTQGTPPVTTYSTTTSTVLSGIIIGIVPYINESGEISMTITPIISDLVRLDEKSFGQAGSQTTLSLPTVDLKELSTTVKVRDGQMVVIGGLISKRENLTDSKVPGAGDIPVAGSLFKSRSKQESRTELVIVLQPVLVSR